MGELSSLDLHCCTPLGLYSSCHISPCSKGLSSDEPVWPGVKAPQRKSFIRGNQTTDMYSKKNMIYLEPREEDKKGKMKERKE